MNTLLKNEKTKLNPISSGFKYINNRRRSGYTIESALGELIDNPLDEIVGATKITLNFLLKRNEQNKLEVHRILICDNGSGMDREDLDNCHKLGSSRTYSQKDLGRFGEGGIMGSLSLCSKRETYTRTKDGIIRASGYDMKLVEEQDCWGSYDIDITQEKTTWFNEMLGEDGVGTIIDLIDLDLMNPTHWHYVKKRITSNFPLMYDSWLSSSTQNKIIINAFLDGKIIETEEILPYEPLHWSEEVSNNGGRQHEVIEHEGHKITVKTVYLEKLNLEKGKLTKTQGGYIYRNGRLLAKGEEVRAMIAGCYLYHNDYRRMRWAIYYDSDSDDIMGTRPSKDGCKPIQSLNDKLINIIDKTKSFVANHIRQEQKDANKADAEKSLSQVEESIEKSFIPLKKETKTINNTVKNNNIVQPNFNQDKESPKIRKKNFRVIPKSMGRLGMIGECILSDNTEYKYDLTVNLDHPTVSFVMQLEKSSQDIAFQFLTCTLACSNSFGNDSDSLSEAERQVMIDRFMTCFSDTMRNQTSYTS